MAINIAKAYVEIVPSTEGLGKAITKTMETDGAKAGKTAGKKIADGISQTAGKAKAGGIMSRLVSAGAAKAAGTKAGAAVSGGIKAGMAKTKGILSKAVTAAEGTRAGRVAANGIRSGLQRVKGALGKVINKDAASAGASAGRAMAGKIKGAIATAGIGYAIVNGVKASMEAYQIQSGAETKLTEIYQKRMGVEAEAAKSTMKLASSLQAQGVVGDEVALSGAQQLATFAKYPDTVNSLLPAMENLLVQQKGLNATADDATGVANLMGKVLGGQTGALKRVGVSFTDAEEKVLKYGTESEKAAMLAKVITNNVGEMNQAMLQTPEGKIQQMKNSLGDLSEQVGGILAPGLATVAGLISTKLIPPVSNLLTKLQGQDLSGVFTTLASAGGQAIQKLSSSIQTALPKLGNQVIGMLNTAASYLSSNGGVILEKGAEIVSNLVTGMANKLPELASAIGRGIQALVATIQAKGPTIAGKMGEMVGKAAPKIIVAAGKLAVALAKGLVKMVPVAVKAAGKAVAGLARGLGITGKISAAANRLKSAVVNKLNETISKVSSIGHNIASKFTSAVSSIPAKVRATFTRVKDALISPITSAKDKLDGIISRIKGLFPLRIGRIFTGLSLPHISVSGGKPPYGIAGKGKLPNFNVTWYRKAEDQPYLFKGATLFGAGERNDEVLYGRRALKRDIAEATAGNRTEGGNTYNFYMTVENASDPEDYARRFANEFQRQVRMA